MPQKPLWKRHRIERTLKNMTSHGGGAAVEPEAADGMEDEYGAMDDAGETWICPELMLECGVKLKQLPVR